MRAVYSVQTIDRQTGEENAVRVEATSPDEARDIVLGLGEMVGSVKLAEVLQDAPTVSSTTKPNHPPGSVAAPCPKCGGTEWTGGRELAVWIVVILLFPIGLLALLVQPTWRCVACRYEYQSYAPPPGLREVRHSLGYRIFMILLLVTLGTFLLLVVGTIALDG